MSQSNGTVLLGFAYVMHDMVRYGICKGKVERSLVALCVGIASER